MLKPTAVALNLMQKDSCTIHDSVIIWKKLHFLTNIVNLKYRGKDLTDKEIENGMDFADLKNQNFLPLLVNLKAEVALFQKFMFCDNIVLTIKPYNWWKSHDQELLSCRS